MTGRDPGMEEVQQMARCRLPNNRSGEKEGLLYAVSMIVLAQGKFSPARLHITATTPGETTYLLPRLVRGRSQSLPKERGEKQNLFNDRSCSKHGGQRYSLPKLLKAARLLKSQINTFLELSLRPSGWTLSHNYKGN